MYREFGIKQSAQADMAKAEALDVDQFVTEALDAAANRSFGRSQSNQMNSAIIRYFKSF